MRECYELCNFSIWPIGNVDTHKYTNTSGRLCLAEYVDNVFDPFKFLYLFVFYIYIDLFHLHFTFLFTLYLILQ